MRYPGLLVGLIALAAIGVALIVWFAKNRRTSTAATWVANTEMLALLPAYRKSRRRSQIAVGVAAVSFTISVVAFSAVAAAPVKRYVYSEELARRDLVLCLDASGSMLPFDGQILRQMQEMVEEFSGERMSLQIWSAETVTKFALTDDYGLILEELDEAARIIDSGLLGTSGTYVNVSPELYEYTAGIEDPFGRMRSSLVGDGLASCVLGFDHRDAERSRTIIYATDNEVMGEQIYELSEAIDFATQQDVNIIALYPAEQGIVTSEGEQMRRLVEAAGGSFYLTTDPGAVKGIVGQIEEEQLSLTEGTSRVIESDRPQTMLLWGALSGLIGMVFLMWRRL